MFIIEVTPIGRGVLPESLSYFSHTSYPRGTLLQIPVRKKNIPGIVMNITEAFSMKAALRAATFSLRRLPEQKAPHYLSPAFLETAERSATYHGTTQNAALFGIIPKEMREGIIPFSALEMHEEQIPTHDTKPRIFAAPFRDRTNEYVRMVRELFAARQSIVFVVPTLEYIEQFKEKLGHGIEAYTVTLFSGQSASALEKAYRIISSEKHPLLIITTPYYACIERQDIGAYVLEHERSNGYVGKVRPYLDYRYILTNYTALRGITCILADTIVRTEEIHALNTGAAIPFMDVSKRLELPGTLMVVMQEPEKDVAFSLLSKKLKYALDQAIKQKKHVFVFCARRGIAPLVACVDCGHILRDPESGSPLALVRTTDTSGTEKRWFVSSVSGYRTPASDLCPHCGSWRLKERGIGIQQVYDELIKHYDREQILLFDHQTASTQKKADRLRTIFFERKGGILLGTALAIPYLTHHIDLSAVISMDSLRALPSWRGQEETFNILMTLREKTDGPVLVQSRTEDEIFDYVRHGTIGDFYAQELIVREECKYPPFNVFIHFAWRTSQHETVNIKKILTNAFAENSLSLYSAPYGEEGPMHYGLIRVPQASWPDADIVAKLRTIPPHIRIMINPDRII